MQPATILFALAAAAATVDAFPPFLLLPPIATVGGTAGVVALGHKAASKFREWKHPSSEKTGGQLQRRGTPRRVHKKKPKAKGYEQQMKEDEAKEKAEKKAKENYVHPIKVGATWDCFWTQGFKAKPNKEDGQDPPHKDFVLHGRDWKVTDLEIYNAVTSVEYTNSSRRGPMNYKFKATRDPPGDNDTKAVNFTVAWNLHELDVGEVENVGKLLTPLLGIEWTSSTGVHCVHPDVSYDGKKQV